MLRRPVCRETWSETARVVMGLAWTATGGDTLHAEAASVEVSEGKGALRTTGEAVMQCFNEQV